MSLYLRLFRTWLWAVEFLQDTRTMTHGHSKGFVSSADARAAMGLKPTSPELPASICAWIDTERLMSV